MTIVYKSETFVTRSGEEMFIEQYAEKPFYIKFWRYGFKDRAISDMLLNRPNKKKLINKY